MKKTTAIQHWKIDSAPTALEGIHRDQILLKQ